MAASDNILSVSSCLCVKRPPSAAPVLRFSSVPVAVSGFFFAPLPLVYVRWRQRLCFFFFRFFFAEQLERSATRPAGTWPDSAVSRVNGPVSAGASVSAARPLTSGFNKGSADRSVRT